jgi:hypothetical protein
MRFLRSLLVALTAAAVLPVFTHPAAADSGEIYSTGNDCVGKLSGYTFLVKDLAGGSDNDYCYIDYGSSKDLPEERRVTIPIDSKIGAWQNVYSQIDWSGIHDVVYFKVCEERENDNDLCSRVAGYALP